MYIYFYAYIYNIPDSWKSMMKQSMVWCQYDEFFEQCIWAAVSRHDAVINVENDIYIYIYIYFMYIYIYKCYIYLSSCVYIWLYI